MEQWLALLKRAYGFHEEQLLHEFEYEEEKLSGEEKNIGNYAGLVDKMRKMGIYLG